MLWLLRATRNHINAILPIISAEPALFGVYADDLFSGWRALRGFRSTLKRRPRVATVAFDGRYMGGLLSWWPKAYTKWRERGRPNRERWILAYKRCILGVSVKRGCILRFPRQSVVCHLTTNSSALVLSCSRVLVFIIMPPSGLSA